MVLESTRPACWNWRRPPEKTAKFGIPRTLYLAARSGNRSVSTFSTTARPASSRATCATCGAAMRHGPHQAAQKSTRMGTLLSRIISSNSSRLTSIGSPIAGSAALQAPHLPVSARCLAGIRFGFPQDGHFRIIGIGAGPFVGAGAAIASSPRRYAREMLPPNESLLTTRTALRHPRDIRRHSSSLETGSLSQAGVVVVLGPLQIEGHKLSINQDDAAIDELLSAAIEFLITQKRG